MAILPKDKKVLTIEVLKERKDILERNLAKLLKRNDLPNKDKRVLRNVFRESIAEVKETIENVTEKGEYGSCSGGRHEIPLTDLQENPCRKICKKCEKKRRKLF